MSIGSSPAAAGAEAAGAGAEAAAAGAEAAAAGAARPLRLKRPCSVMTSLAKKSDSVAARNSSAGRRPGCWSKRRPSSASICQLSSSLVEASPARAPASARVCTRTSARRRSPPAFSARPAGSACTENSALAPASACSRLTRAASPK